jgi:hypothetical protein
MAAVKHDKSPQMYVDEDLAFFAWRANSRIERTRLKSRSPLTLHPQGAPLESRTADAVLPFGRPRACPDRPVLRPTVGKGATQSLPGPYQSHGRSFRSRRQ